MANYEYHRLIGKLLFPLRFILLINFYLIIIISIYTLGIFSKYYTNKFLVFMNKLCIYISGINLHIEGRENLSNKKKIIISNHINIFDIHLIINIFNKILPFIASNYLYIYPLNKLFDYSDSVIINKHKNTGGIDKIKKHFNNKNELVIFPDACNIIPNNLNISSFKNGAFVHKLPIQPIIIRYVPSSNKNVNINNNSLIINLCKFLMDGHIDVFIKILPLEEYKDHYKDDYKNLIYKKMSDGLKLLPNQYPPGIIFIKKNYSVISKIFLYFYFTIGILNYISSNYYKSSSYLLFFISNYFNYKYNTNNTQIFTILINFIIIYHYIK